jgi:hypothetical protein
VGDGAPPITNTDAKGNFTLADLLPGQDKVKGRRNGYLNTYYCARRPDSVGTTLTIKAGKAMEDVRLKLLPHRRIGRHGPRGGWGTGILHAYRQRGAATQVFAWSQKVGLPMGREPD